MSSVVSVPSLKEFFKSLLVEAIDRQRLRVTPLTEFYLVNLLSEFAASENLFTQQQDGRREQEPLAILYHRALQQERDERVKTLRRLGDVSLYTAGFFAGSLKEQAVGPDYYIQMGGAAYGQVATLTPGFGELFRELGLKFRELVEVLEEIAARGMASNGPVGTLKVYETWVRTKDEKLERVLIDAGMVPTKGDLPN